jgi:hypothetical protein
LSSSSSSSSFATSICKGIDDGGGERLLSIK